MALPRSSSLRRVVGALLFALLVGVGAACSPGPVTLRQGAREYIAADYEKLLERWTRGDRLYSLQGVDDVLSVTSTFEAYEFRYAYVIRYAEDYGLTIDQRRDLLATTLADTEGHHQFYVSLYSSRPNDGDLTKPVPTWVVRLLDDKGHITAPDEIIPIRRPGALEKTYFPYTTPWRQSFRIRFPTENAAGATIAPDAASVSLRFSGPLGNGKSLDLQWMLTK